MNSKYGFGDSIDLPQTDETRPSITPGLVEEAAEAAKTLGFASRETPSRRRPGPKRTEPQAKISIPGPKRVIDEFRMFCNERDVTLWRGLEILLAQRSSN